MVSARSIAVPGEAAAWERLGFAIARDGGATQIGGITLTFGAAALEVAATGLAAERPDGLPLVSAHARTVPDTSLAHPNGAVVLDHVVAVTDDMDRTLAALAAAGLELRRRAGAMAFLRLGECILEVVERPGAPVHLWGLVVVVPELGGLGPLVGDAKPAVQPGRRIATVRPEAGAGIALAFMTPRPQPSRRG